MQAVNYDKNSNSREKLSINSYTKHVTTPNHTQVVRRVAAPSGNGVSID